MELCRTIKRTSRRAKRTSAARAARVKSWFLFRKARQARTKLIIQERPQFTRTRRVLELAQGFCLFQSRNRRSGARNLLQGIHRNALAVHHLAFELIYD